MKFKERYWCRVIARAWKDAKKARSFSPLNVGIALLLTILASAWWAAYKTEGDGWDKFIWWAIVVAIEIFVFSLIFGWRILVTPPTMETEAAKNSDDAIKDATERTAESMRNIEAMINQMKSERDEVIAAKDGEVKRLGERIAKLLHPTRKEQELEKLRYWLSQAKNIVKMADQAMSDQSTAEDLRRKVMEWVQGAHAKDGARRFFTDSEFLTSHIGDFLSCVKQVRFGPETGRPGLPLQNPSAWFGHTKFVFGQVISLLERIHEQETRAIAKEALAIAASIK